MFWGSPNISGFYLVLNLSSKNLSKVIVFSVPLPQDGFALTPRVPMSALSKTPMPETPNWGKCLLDFAGGWALGDPKPDTPESK